MIRIIMIIYTGPKKVCFEVLAGAGKLKRIMTRGIPLSTSPETRTSPAQTT
jgi:hypothetical protein